MARRYYNNDPRVIKARFDSVCKETGKPIKRGEYCIYYPTGKAVYHNESKQAQAFREWQEDIAMGYDY